MQVCGLEDEPLSFPYFLYSLQTGSYMRKIDEKIDVLKRKELNQMKNSSASTPSMIVSSSINRTVKSPRLQPKLNNIEKPKFQITGSAPVTMTAITMATSDKGNHNVETTETKKSSTTIPPLPITIRSSGVAARPPPRSGIPRGPAGPRVSLPPSLNKSSNGRGTPTAGRGTPTAGRGTPPPRRGTPPPRGGRKSSYRQEPRSSRMKKYSDPSVQQSLVNEEDKIIVVLVVKKRPSSFWWSQVMKVAKDIHINLYLCVGDVLQPIVLKRICASYAKHVVILPNNRVTRTTTMNGGDAASILMSKAFESFTKKEWMHSEPGKFGKNEKTFEHITTVRLICFCKFNFFCLFLLLAAFLLFPFLLLPEQKINRYLL
jgi:hypothetical protein